MKIDQSTLDFGGEGPVIQMLHANAYPPECYRKFLSPFLDRFHVVAPRQRPLQKGEDASQLTSWSLFRDDLIRDMDKRGLKGVIGMGHSLGGVASWMAAIERPDLFSRLILIDPVIIANHFVRGTSILPFSFKKKYLPIVKIASKRRNRWADRAEARSHLGAKKIFQRFDPEVFEDFLQHGIRDDHESVVLAFPREWEARIYATPPNLWPLMDKSTCPVHIIKAQYSDVITSKAWIRIQNKTAKGVFREMEGVGHLVPFEKPLELAHVILSELQEV